MISKQFNIRHWRVGGFLVVSLSLLTLFGCDNGGGRITGKVTVQGKEVQGGSITFTPLGSSDRNPGKPASAAVNKDGTYTVTERATAGKNKVSYMPPVTEWDATKAKPGDQPPRSPYDGLAPKQQEVEIKGGANTIDIELVPSGQR